MARRVKVTRSPVHRPTAPVRHASSSSSSSSSSTSSTSAARPPASRMQPSKLRQAPPEGIDGLLPKPKVSVEGGPIRARFADLVSEASGEAVSRGVTRVSEELLQEQLSEMFAYLAEPLLGEATSTLGTRVVQQVVVGPRSAELAKAARLVGKTLRETTRGLARRAGQTTRSFTSSVPRSTISKKGIRIKKS